MEEVLLDPIRSRSITQDWHRSPCDRRRDHLDKAHRLGRAIAQSGCALLTGACPGLPLAAACGAKQEGGLVNGILPGLSLEHLSWEFQSLLGSTENIVEQPELIANQPRH